MPKKTLMIEKYLKAKHWQIFLLIIIFPIILKLILTYQISVNIGVEENKSIESILTMMVLLPFLGIIFLFAFFGWFWSISVGLHNKIPQGVELDIERFKILFFVPIVYILIIIIKYATGWLNGGFDNQYARIVYAVIFVLLHLFSMFCIFYIMYFSAKTIKTVELQRKVEIGDYFSDLFLFGIYIIGIWFIQPRLNKLISA
jgi:hypothetical protein